MPSLLGLLALDSGVHNSQMMLLLEDVQDVLRIHGGLLWGQVLPCHVDIDICVGPKSVVTPNLISFADGLPLWSDSRSVTSVPHLALLL
jgi:hypothetical protein